MWPTLALIRFLYNFLFSYTETNFVEILFCLPGYFCLHKKCFCLCFSDLNRNVWSVTKSFHWIATVTILNKNMGFRGVNVTQMWSLGSAYLYKKIFLTRYWPLKIDNFLFSKEDTLCFIEVLKTFILLIWYKRKYLCILTERRKTSTR